MKKYYTLPLLLVLVPSISACQDTKHSIVAINNMGSDFGIVEISTGELLTLIESKQQFLLEQYSPNCSICKELKPLLQKYAKQEKKVIYTCNVNSLTEEDFEEFYITPYPDIFKGNYVPRLQFINKGKLTYEVSSSKFDSFFGLKSIINKHFLSSNITLIQTEEDLNAFTNMNENYVAYCYDLESEKSLSLANQYIITKEVANSKKPVVLINYSTYTGVFNDVCAKYNADFISFASLVKNGEVNKTIDYESADGSELNSLLVSL